jgi:hypothetical protein
MAISLHPMLRPYKPSSDSPFDRVKAAHLLNRCGFGGTTEEIEKVLSLGPVDAVDWLLDFPDAPAEEQSQVDVPDLSSIDGYPRNFREIQLKMRGMTLEERQAYRQMLQRDNRLAIFQTAAWWLKRMANGPHPLQEKLALFWHGHFTTSAKDERAASLMWNQNELLRRNAAGNFRTFVREISRDPAMLDYLNNQQNRKKHPNENYARELMELFTLGIGNYTEHDIREGARAFTGWAHDGEDFIYRKFDHDTGEKTFFGQKGNFDGDDIIDIILHSKACAPYIASRFWNNFVNESIDPALCMSLGELLRDNDYELRPMLRTLFTSKAFYQPQNIGVQIKSPVQLVVSTIRSLGVKPPEYQRLYGALEQMGQIPLMPPNVKGWPGGRMWINTSTLFVRYNTALWLAGGEPIVSGRRLMDAGNKFRRQQAPDIGVDTDGAPSQIVDEWVDRLVQRSIPEEKRSVLIDVVGKKPTEASVRNMINLILSMPEYQLC